MCRVILFLMLFIIPNIHAFKKANKANIKYLCPLSISVNSHDWSTDLGITAMEGYNLLDQFNTGDNIFMSAGLAALRWYYSEMIMIVIHEYGHGIRVRELGGIVMEYEYEFRLLGIKGLTRFFLTKEVEQSSIRLGGMENTSFLATKISNRFLQHGITPSSAVLYASTSLDQIMYIIGTAHMPITSLTSGDDIVGYVADINKAYGSDTLTLSQMNTRNLISLLDPLLWYSLYIGLFSPAQNVDMPGITLTEDLQWLPMLRTIFTPYGYEYSLTNFLQFDEMSAKLSLTFGYTYDNKTVYSIHGFVPEIFKYDNWSLGLEASAWQQQTLDDRKEMYLGGMVMASGNYSLSEQISLNTSIGYKSDGYVQGYPSANSFLATLRTVISF